MRKLIGFFLLLIFINAGAQSSLPISALRSSDTTKPLLLYVSGDGGLSNSFSPLLKRMNSLGFSIIGLNAQSYFWKKKKPQRVTEDFTNLLSYYMNAWHCKSYVLIGYSFGADVIPFIENRLPLGLASMNKYTILMSPSKKTDFEIHILGMVGCELGAGYNIPREINKMTGGVTIFFGREEHKFPMQEINNANIHFAWLPGGHHYHSDVDEIVSRIRETVL